MTHPRSIAETGRSRLRTWWLLALACAFTLPSCSGDNDVTQPVSITSISPSAPALKPGETVTLTATVSTPDAGSRVRWRTASAAVVTISGSGLTAQLTAVAPGTSAVTAYLEGDESVQLSVQATVSDPVPTQLSIQTQPAGAVSGVPFTTQPVVRILDAAGQPVTSGSGATGDVTASIATGTGTLVGTATVRAANGVATFTNLGITGSGAYTLRFAVTSPSLSATSASITVTPGAPTRLAIAAQPADAVSGVAFATQPVIEIRDAFGSRTNSTAAVTVAIAGGTGTLGGTTTVNAVNGVATFTNLQIAGSGAHTLAFSSTGLGGATSSSINVTQVAASLALTTQPSTATSGAAFAPQPVVRILDNAGLVVTTGAGAGLTVTAAIATGTGTLNGTTTAVAANGVATFTNLGITGTGAHTLRFTTTSPALTVTSASIAVAAGAAAQMTIETQPAGAVSGVQLTTQPVVRIRDALGNPVSTSGTTVTAAIANGSGTLSGTTAVTTVSGVATFTDLKLAGSGPHTLVFTATGLPAAISAPFTVTQVAAALLVTTQPAGAVNGATFTTPPSVRIVDNAGLVITSGAAASANVTAAIATGTGTLNGTTTVAAVNGVATFTNLGISGLGAHTLRFSTLTPALTVTSASVDVGPSNSGLGRGLGAEQFALIPTGTYQRGASNGDADELPIRAITISAFYMQKTEVTQTQWRDVMGNEPPVNPSWFASCGDTCPVENVTWTQIQTFLTRLNASDPGHGYRLPTEAEWEYAARAETTGDYNVANTPVESLGWINSNSQARTWPVAQKIPNAWGLFDMHGNVAEWVSDWYAADYYAASVTLNPLGPATGTARAIRGGSYNDLAREARAAGRYFDLPNSRTDSHGFRLVRVN